MSEIDDLEAFETPEPSQEAKNRYRNVQERARMKRHWGRRMRVSDKEADAIYARVLAEIRART